VSALFDHSRIRFDVLRDRAFNLRWAEVHQDCIPLTAADPDFPCAPEISTAIERFARDRYFSYGPPEGHAFFREAIADHYREKRNVDITPANVMACDSAAFGIRVVCQTLLGSGDEAIILDPVDFLFRYSVEQAGAEPVEWSLPVNPEESPDFNRLESLINRNTRLICLCNPVNPTGRVFSRKELETIARVAERHGLTILSDEIWSDIVFAPSTYVSIASLEEARMRTVIVTGFSKSYGLAGLRAGAIISADATVFEKILHTSEHRFTVHGSGVMAQVAATAALRESSYWLEEFLEHLTKMREFVAGRFNELPGISCKLPQGCYVAFADIRQTGRTASEIHHDLLTRARVAVVPGLPRWFGPGADGHIRISFATSKEVLEEAFQRMERVLAHE
jgi:aspartate/methionine/tyrosine aminotransferase